MAVMLTERAAGEIKRVLADQKLTTDTTVLRVGVAGGGCSGYSYDLRFDSQVDATVDFVLEQHGVRVAVDKKSDLYLDGTTIDYFEDISKRGFTFDNPNARKSCGCGSSFST